MKTSKLFILILGSMSIGLFAACSGFQSTSTTAMSTTTCMADQSWVTSPSLPSEIPDQGADFCDFYQFSWQSFLYLMSPSSGDVSIRNFEDVANYPILQNSNSCSASSSTPNLFVRMVKDNDSSPEFTIPEAIGQAGGGATIYDQKKNVVYYSVSFSEDLCTKAQSPNPTAGNLPTNTIEMKLAWQVIDDTQTGDYVSMQADIVKSDDSDKMTTLGLVGFHLVQGTPLHPEFVWASYEHKNNAPNCIDATAAPFRGVELYLGDLQYLPNHPRSDLL